MCVESTLEIYDENRTDIRVWISEKLAAIEAIEDANLQMLCIYSLLEAFSSEFSNYEDKNSFESFSRFIIKFSGESNQFLERHDPVSMYYDFEDELRSDFNLEFLGSLSPTSIELVNRDEIADKMVKLLKRTGSHTEREIDKHKYIRMLYIQRCKLVHEHSQMSISPRFSSSKSNDIPQYICVSYGDCNNEGEIASKDIWQFDFPLGYLKNLFVICSNNYLVEFEDSRTARKQSYPWCTREIVFDNYEKFDE